MKINLLHISPFNSMTPDQVAEYNYVGFKNEFIDVPITDFFLQQNPDTKPFGRTRMPAVGESPLNWYFWSDSPDVIKGFNYCNPPVSVHAYPHLFAPNECDHIIAPPVLGTYSLSELLKWFRNQCNGFLGKTLFSNAPIITTWTRVDLQTCLYVQTPVTATITAFFAPRRGGLFDAITSTTEYVGEEKYMPVNGGSETLLVGGLRRISDMEFFQTDETPYPIPFADLCTALELQYNVTVDRNEPIYTGSWAFLPVITLTIPTNEPWYTYYPLMTQFDADEYIFNSSQFIAVYQIIGDAPPTPPIIEPFKPSDGPTISLQNYGHPFQRRIKP